MPVSADFQHYEIPDLRNYSNSIKLTLVIWQRKKFHNLEIMSYQLAQLEYSVRLPSQKP
jgi:hypothetical protein